jgi:hypothetical protein
MAKPEKQSEINTIKDTPKVVETKQEQKEAVVVSKQKEDVIISKDPKNGCKGSECDEIVETRVTIKNINECPISTKLVTYQYDCVAEGYCSSFTVSVRNANSCKGE